MTMTGQCLCGAVKVEAAEFHDTAACHCGMCRRWSGGPFFAAEPNDVRWSGDTIATFRSSDWAERGFCGKCGTSLFYRLTADGKSFVNPYLFQGAEKLDFAAEVFIDEKPGTYAFEGERARITGAELFAAATGGGDGAQ